MLGGDRVILQYVRCRAARNDEDQRARYLYLRRVAHETASLFDEPDIRLIAHAGADEPDGARVAFWTQPFDTLTALTKDSSLSPRDLVELGLLLARRLVLRHGKGRVDALLSEHVLFRGTNGIKVAAIPVYVSSKWLTPGAIPARLAPEERAEKEPHASGDLWRLGHTLLSLAQQKTMMPSGLRALIGELTEPDLDKRTHDAPSAVAALETLLAELPTQDLRSIPPPDHPGGSTRPSSVTTGIGTATTEDRARSPLDRNETVPDWGAAQAKDHATSPRSDTVRDPPQLGASLGDAIPNLPPLAALELSLSELPTLGGLGGPLPDLGVAPPADVSPAPFRPSGAIGDLLAPLERALDLNPGFTVRPQAQPIEEDAAIESKPLSVAPPAPRPEVTQSLPDTLAIRPSEDPLELKRIPEESALAPSANEAPSPTDAPVPNDAEGSSKAPSEGDALSESKTSSDGANIADEGPGDESLAKPLPTASADALAITSVPPDFDRSSALASGPATALGIDPSELKTNVEDYQPPTPSKPFDVPQVEAPEPKTRAESGPALQPPMSDTEVQRIGAVKAAWDTPEYPSGASPWSAVVAARGTFRRGETDFTGYPDELPPADALMAKASRPEAAPTPPPAAFEPIAPRPPTDFEEAALGTSEIRAAVRVFNPTKVALGAGLVLSILGLFILASREDAEPIPAGPSFAVAPVHELVLSSDPPNARVYSEADGGALGSTPIRFLIPPGSESAVLVALDGYEPSRIVLSDRGRLVASLHPIAPSSSCEVRIASELRLESVDGGEISRDAPTAVNGAIVIRAKVGQDGIGARIVRCPSLGGHDRAEPRFDRPWPPATIRVVQPAGGSAYLGGEPIGTVPTARRLIRAFSLVRVDDANGRSTSRWVPTVSDTEVQMPAPELAEASLTAAGVEPTNASASTLTAPDVRSPDAKAQDAKAQDAKSEPKTPEVKAPLPSKTAVTEAKTESREPPKEKKSVTSRADKERAKKQLQAGSRFLLAGRTDKAKAALEDCLRADPEEAACHRALGTLFRRDHANVDAKKHFARYLELRPDAEDATTIRRILETL